MVASRAADQRGQRVQIVAPDGKTAPTAAQHPALFDFAKNLRSVSLVE